MKNKLGISFGVAILVAASLQCRAQGFIYDQQATNTPSIFGDYLNIQEDSPLLESFVPTLTSIGFVQMEFWDIPDNGTSGATVYVNLWTGSPNVNSATLISSTTPVYMPNGFGNDNPGVTSFYFSSPITLTPGQSYYLQPVVQSGDDPWDVWDPGNTYPNGTLYDNGLAFGVDIWFREGIQAAPEPTSLALIGVGSVLVFVLKHRSGRLLD
jgi:hypothetical protein